MNREQGRRLAAKAPALARLAAASTFDSGKDGLQPVKMAQRKRRKHMTGLK